MKKILCLLLAITLTLTLCPFVQAADGDVEIKFKVGDSTLLINGNPVTVVTPYVVGEGVTLVPVRVITEAFGAKVDWVDATRTVLLTYPDVNISLQIENPVAEVNGKAEKLLAAPELTNSSTMVPLRFISENFGAEVSYDAETEAITVVKKSASNSESTIVEGMSDHKYIGDSYYGWSMENPKDMQMNTRYFDGTLTSFTYDNNNGIKIAIYAKDKDFDFEEEFKTGKDVLRDLTLVKADKDTSNPKKKTIHLQAKDKTAFYDIHLIETDKYLFRINGIFENEQSEWKNTALHILSTFDTTYTGKDTYNLSNVENGYRKFEAETVKLSFNVPQELIMTSDEDAETDFRFYNISPEDAHSSIHANVYSKSSVESAEALAKKDHSSNKRTINENIVQHFDQEVSTKTYAGIETYTYAYEFKLTSASVYTRDTFFEIGDYVYNIAVDVKLPVKDKDEYVDNILNSIKAEELDPEEVGNILYNFERPEGTFTADDLAKCTMEIPKTYNEISASSSSASYAGYTGSLLCTALTDRKYTHTELSAIIQAMQTSQKNTSDTIITQPSGNISIGKNSFIKYSCKTVEDGEVFYGEVFATTKNGIAYIFIAEYSEFSYSQFARNEINSIIASITFKQ